MGVENLFVHLAPMHGRNMHHMWRFGLARVLLFFCDSKSSKRTQDCAWESGALEHMIQWTPQMYHTLESFVFCRLASPAFFTGVAASQGVTPRGVKPFWGL